MPAMPSTLLCWTSRSTCALRARGFVERKLRTAMGSLVLTVTLRCVRVHVFWLVRVLCMPDARGGHAAAAAWLLRVVPLICGPFLFFSRSLGACRRRSSTLPCGRSPWSLPFSSMTFGSVVFDSFIDVSLPCAASILAVFVSTCTALMASCVVDWSRTLRSLTRSEMTLLKTNLTCFGRDTLVPRAVTPDSASRSYSESSAAIDVRLTCQHVATSGDKYLHDRTMALRR